MKHPEFLETSSDVLIGATHLLQTPVPRSYGTWRWRSPCRRARWTTGYTGVSQGSGRSRLIDPENCYGLTCSQEETHLLQPLLQSRGANGQGGEGPLAGGQGGQRVMQEGPLVVQANTVPLLTQIITDQPGSSVTPFCGQQ